MTQLTGPERSLHGDDAVASVYPPLVPLLRRLCAAVPPALGPQFVGLYLHGSLATGAFDAERSDVDFLVATAGKLPREMLPRLAALHESLFRGGLPLATRLEGSYIPLAALRRYDPDDSHHPALRIDGTLDVDFHGRDWIIQRHVIREHGLALAGPPPATSIDPVPPAALRAAARDALHEWWAPMLADPHRLGTREYQAFAVLTMCRALYTVVHGQVATKPQAAHWAVTALDACWTPLIQRALAWRPDELLTDLDETLAFMRYTLARVAPA